MPAFWEMNRGPLYAILADEHDGTPGAVSAARLVAVNVDNLVNWWDNQEMMRQGVE